MVVVDQSVADGIGDPGIPDALVPVAQGELTRSSVERVPCQKHQGRRQGATFVDAFAAAQGQRGTGDFRREKTAERRRSLRWRVSPVE